MSGAVAVGVAAVAIGTAVATDFATFAVIAAVGATVGAIGSVAKVPALQIAGAAIGVAGAVGGFASAAGVFGAEGVFGSVNTTQGFTASQALSVASSGQFAESGAQVAGMNAAAAAGAGAPELGAAGWGGGGSGVVDTVNSGVNPLTTTAAASSPAIPAAADGAEPSNVNGQAGEQLAQVTQNQNTGTFANPGAVGAPTPPGGPLLGGGTTPDYINAASTGGITKTGATDVGSTTWGDIFGFLKENKTLASGAVQAIGSFASGMLNPLTPAQINALDAQAKANRAAANRSDAEAAILQTRANNMGQPLPVASLVTGRPTLGLLQQASPVTGVPA